jgi:flagellar hook protein FlgE
MSITSSFYSALSGMDSNGIALQVIADNISNSNTVGFKGSSVQFEDILGMSLEGIGGSNRLGVGASVASMAPSFTQGTLTTTGVGTDLAINGKGFFIVENSVSSERYYTRAGNFHLDNNGYFVNANDQRVQGYLYDNAGTNLTETLADIKIEQTNMIAPSVSSQVEIALNLDSQDTNKTFSIMIRGTLPTTPQP